MARGVNKVIIIGNLGADPEIRYIPNSGSPVATLRIATSEGWRDKQTGEMQEKTEWHRVVLFNRLAEIANQYLRKGSKIFIEGKLRTNKWQDNNGQDRYTTEIVANELQMLDNRAGGDAGPMGSISDSASHNDFMGMGDSGANSSPNSGSNSGSNSNKNRAVPENMADFNDDIPF